jgi:hypothetical protein
LKDVEAVLRKAEESFKLEDFQSAFNLYTFGIEKIRFKTHLSLGLYVEFLEPVYG